ncbi:MAG: AtpZ/AtpI family protein [Chitinophagales bacterium]
MAAKDKRPVNNYMHYSGMAFQMMATMLVCAYLGIKLDEWFVTKALFTIIFLLLGVIGSMYTVIKSVSKTKK